MDASLRKSVRFGSELCIDTNSISNRGSVEDIEKIADGTDSESEEIIDDKDTSSDDMLPDDPFGYNDSQNKSSTPQDCSSSRLPCTPSNRPLYRRTSTRRFSITQTPEFQELWKAKKLKFEKLEAYFFNTGMAVALGALFVAANIVVAAHAAYQFTPMGGYTTNDPVLRITLPIARAGGRLVTFNCAWLLLTACKHIWTWIRTNVVPIVPLGFPIDDIMPKYHRVVALTIIFSGLVIHTLPQIFNYGMGSLKPDDNRIWTFGDGMATTQLLVTGILLVLIFVMFFLTTLKAFRKTTTGFRWFWWFHMTGIALCYPLLILHGTYKGNPIFLAFVMGPLLLYIFDVCMRRSNSTKTRILECKIHNGGGEQITELVVECPKNFDYTPGQYAELKYLPLSKTEWHPFTIASAPNRDVRIYNGKEVRALVFFIKAGGRWTNAMYQHAKSIIDENENDNSRFDVGDSINSRMSNGAIPINPNDATIYLRGPHGAPAMNYEEYKHILVIGSGVGVTPLLSVWQSMIPKISPDDSDSDVDAVDDNSDEYNFNGKSTAISTLPVSLRSESGDLKITKWDFQLQELLESLTMSIFLFVLFLSGETMIAVTYIFGFSNEVAVLETVLSSVSLLIHGTTVIVGMASSDSVFSHLCQFKCWIELCIILVDNGNLCMSVLLLSGQSSGLTNWIVGFSLLSVGLHMIRIFHVFFTTLKPSTISKGKQGQKSKIKSIKGIFINRRFAGMQFCFEQLLRPLGDEEALSKAFSMQFCGTRETTMNVSESLTENSKSVRASHANCYSFHNGRPDWEKVFKKAIRRAQRSDPKGASIGVFFCGSPAIAKVLRATADKVNAKHQFATKRMMGTTSDCKIVVHVENF